MNRPAPRKIYSTAQRAVALLYGLTTHLIFVIGVGAMMAGLYTGLTIGRGPWIGGWSLCANSMLVLQFPILHSFFLSYTGQKWMSRLSPPGLGRDLNTTLFSLFAALQLTGVFLLWSPSGVVWYRPHSLAGWMFWVLPYATAWGLLIKGMIDAGLAIQMGSLGWWAVFRGRPLVYPSFQVRGLYKYVRQPVYIAFALTLWTGAVWTPDRLAIALAWTTYCLIGPRLKERRYRKNYGEIFTRYQRAVSFWIPHRPIVALHGPVQRIFRRGTLALCNTADSEVLIAGAGPVGLLLANLLGARGIRTLLVEKRALPTPLSMAIGVTPPSLQILKTLELDSELLRQGVRIQKAFIHGSRGVLGGVSFDQLPGDYPFILSVPQGSTLRVLEDNLVRFPSVKVLRDTEVVGVEQSPHCVDIRMRDASGKESGVRTSYLAACDGHKGPLRDFMGISTDETDYGLTFLMADFEDRSGWGMEAHLFFTPSGSVESFPLPAGRRRWVVLTDRFLNNATDGLLEQTVKARTGLDLSGSKKQGEISFQVRRALARRYYSGRVALCGDAAHVMSPIGGQGMNTGFADAEFLAHVFETILRDKGDAGDLLNHYDFFRRRAFSAASNRAACGMWLGTRTGFRISRLRDFILRNWLLQPPLNEFLPAYFAMLTIPFNTLAHVPEPAPAPENRP